MKLRSLPVAVAAAAALLISTVGLSPAQAVPAAPDLATVSTGVAGHITGDAGTAELWVYVGLQANQSDATAFATTAGSAHFDVATWGYADVTVYAWACPAQVLDATCSLPATFHAGSPTDVTLPAGDPQWFSDDTVGPADTASVTITDAAGGGDLVATWAPVPGSPVTTALTRGAATQLNLSDGDGTVTINRCSQATPSECTALDPATSKALHVHTAALGVSVGTIAEVNANHPTSTFVVTADRAGTYSMTYHLEATGAPGTAVPGTTPAGPASGTLNGSGDTDPTTVLAPGTVADGTYKVVGQITVVDPAYGTFSDVGFTSSAFTIHRQGPLLTSSTASPTTIYPLISNNTTYKSATKFTLVGAGVPQITSVKLYKNSNGALTRTLTLTPVDPTHATVAWNGRQSDDTTPALAGLYNLKVADVDGNVSTTVGSVTVSGLKLVLKTLTKTISASGSVQGKFVGNCSTLRRPSLRGWALSLGFYSNTKCATQTFAASAVSTVHATRLPIAYKYVDFRVSSYGGAATAKPHSIAVIRYLTVNGVWVSETNLTPTLGWHRGPTRSATNMIDSDRYLAWGFVTAFSNRYDLAKFTVVVRYYVLG